MRISDWSSDGCSFDLILRVDDTDDLVDVAATDQEAGMSAVVDLAPDLVRRVGGIEPDHVGARRHDGADGSVGQAQNALDHLPFGRREDSPAGALGDHRTDLLLGHAFGRSEEHTSELQSLMRISYAVFCLKKKTTT